MGFNNDGVKVIAERLKTGEKNNNNPEDPNHFLIETLR
jgi:hypothetical protein